MTGTTGGVSHYYARTLGGLLSQTAARVPDKEAIVFEGERLTWRQVDERVDAVASGLLALGVRPGDRVAVMCTIRPEHVVATVAAVRIGAIAVGVNVLLSPREVLRLLQVAKPSVLVVLAEDRGKRVAEVIAQALTGLEPGVQLVTIGAGRPGTGFEQLLRTPRAESLAALAKDVPEEAGAFMLFTSGSTGEPKAVLLTHRNVIDNIAVQARHFGMVATDRILVQLPLSHCGGVTELLIPGLMLGATLVLLERFHPARALELVGAEHLTFVHQVPTMYVMMLELPGFAEYDLSSLRCVCVAGAPTPADVMRRMMAMAPQVFTGYGMTEVAGFVTYTQAGDDADAICRTVGAIAPEFELRVVDEHNLPARTRTPGEVVLRGTCLMPCYYENPNATAEAIDPEGWLHTGDIGWLDERRYLTLIGRRKLMYITGGYNVYPSEVEEFLASHPDVALAACVGVKDAVFGEVGAAFIVARPGRTLDADALRAHCRGGLADYKTPRIFHFRAELPLTSLGKIDRQALKRELEPR